MASALTNDQLLRLARHGAQARILELRNEIAAIERAFPDLTGGRQGGRAKGRGRAADGATATASGEDDASRKTGGRRGWNAAQRKAAADRMKNYWAQRKATKKR